MNSKFSYTFCPNEIAVSDSEGIVEEWIGFGGEMEPDEQEKKMNTLLLLHGIKYVNKR